jgi:hypothetical protein
MAEADYETWREKGHKIGRQLLESLDVMALEAAIHRPGGNRADAELRRHPDRSNAYRVGLRDALNEHHASHKLEA